MQSTEPPSRAFSMPKAKERSPAGIPAPLRARFQAHRQTKTAGRVGRPIVDWPGRTQAQMPSTSSNRTRASEAWFHQPPFLWGYVRRQTHRTDHDSRKRCIESYKKNSGSKTNHQKTGSIIHPQAVLWRSGVAGAARVSVQLHNCVTRMVCERPNNEIMRCLIVMQWPTCGIPKFTQFCSHACP